MLQLRGLTRVSIRGTGLAGISERRWVKPYTNTSGRQMVLKRGPAEPPEDVAPSETCRDRAVNPCGATAADVSGRDWGCELMRGGGGRGRRVILSSGAIARPDR